MTFFVASAVPGGGNLGGVVGADRICQSLAQAHGAGNHTWHAYLSTQTTPQAVGVDARARIGTGPWYNAKGVMIAASVADLHGDLQRDRNNVQMATALNESGTTRPGMFDPGNEHDILTGSDSDGRAIPTGLDTTCDNWTSDSPFIGRCSVTPTAPAAACRGIPPISAATARRRASSRLAARVIWAIMARGGIYRAPQPAGAVIS
jgi:hypothetical protein